MASNPDWSREEVEACVADYLDMLTLELNGQQAEILAQARQRGTLSLALRSLADAKPNLLSETTEDPQQTSSRINFVRFGINSSQTVK